MLMMIAFLFFLLWQTATATDPSDLGPVIAVIVGRALMLTSLTKPIIDSIGKAWLGLCGPKLPFIAVGVAAVLDALLMLVVGQAFNGKSLGMLALTAIFTGLGSKAVTDFHNKSNE